MLDQLPTELIYYCLRYCTGETVCALSECNTNMLNIITRFLSVNNFDQVLGLLVNKCWRVWYCMNYHPDRVQLLVMFWVCCYFKNNRLAWRVVKNFYKQRVGFDYHLSSRTMTIAEYWLEKLDKFLYKKTITLAGGFSNLEQGDFTGCLFLCCHIDNINMAKWIATEAYLLSIDYVLYGNNYLKNISTLLLLYSRLENSNKFILYNSVMRFYKFHYPEKNSKQYLKLYTNQNKPFKINYNWIVHQKGLALKNLCIHDYYFWERMQRKACVYYIYPYSDIIYHSHFKSL